MMGQRERGQGLRFYEFTWTRLCRLIISRARSTPGSILGGCTRSLSSTAGIPADPQSTPNSCSGSDVARRLRLCHQEWICAEVRVNLAYRWFCRLGIEDTTRSRTIPPSRERRTSGSARDASTSGARCLVTRRSSHRRYQRSSGSHPRTRRRNRRTIPYVRSNRRWRRL